MGLDISGLWTDGNGLNASILCVCAGAKMAEVVSKYTNTNIHHIPDDFLASNCHRATKETPVCIPDELVIEVGLWFIFGR